MALLRTSLLTVLLAATLLVRGQLYPTEFAARGSGTVQGCDTSLHVGFTSEIVGPYTYVFSPVVTPGITAITGSVWSYYTTDFYQLLGEVNLQVAFPGAGDYPVCLTVNAIDPETLLPCSTTTCDLFQPLADASCASLIADFTISAVDGQAVTFADLSSFTATIEQSYWSFGDGTSSVEAMPSHTFDGPGPHEVCLTVVGPAPVHCSTTMCKWLYLGPAGVECSTLLEQGYLLLQQDNLVGVLDTSHTSGMNSAVTWDFGDGTIAEGTVAVHAYDGGSFQLCSTVRLWGPLTTDTCISTLCRTVDAFPAAFVGERADGNDVHTWPNPFTDHLSLSGFTPGVVDIRVDDACGRSVYRALVHTENRSVVLDLGHLDQGTYWVRCTQAGLVHTGHTVKQ
ncbi:MAG: PKD domain-containing protein [Flavobacteriales bacterium]